MNDERGEPDTEDAEGSWLTSTPATSDRDGGHVTGHVQYRPPTEDGVTGRSGFDKAPPAHDDEP